MNRYFKITIRGFFVLALLGICFPVSMFSQDTSCGIHWYPPILLSDTAYDAYSPKIALSGDDTVHVVWESGKPSLRLPYRRSTDGGQVFISEQDLLVDTMVFRYPSGWNYIATNKEKTFVVFRGGTGSDTPVHFMKSSDAGKTWSNVIDISAEITGVINSVAVYDDTLSVVYSPPPGYRRILRSTDAGATWTKTTEDLSVYSQIALTSSALHLIFDRWVTNSTEIEYRLSHDLGSTWDKTEILSEIDGYWSDMPIIASDGDSLILAAWRDTKFGCLGVLGCSIESRTGVISGTHDTTTWGKEETLTDKPRGFRVEAFLINGMRAVGWVDEVTANDTFHVVTRISKRTSTGWCPIIDHTPDIQKALYPVIALSHKGIHIVWVQQLGRRIAVFYQRGVFIPTDVKEKKETIPNGFSLSQNYPNPFNPSTKIRFKIQDAGFTSLKVYDVFGREVATLVNEKKQPGEYEVEWNPSSSSGQVLSSGVYFYRLTIYDSRFMLHTETKKAILMK